MTEPFAKVDALDPAIFTTGQRKLFAELRILRARAMRLNCPATAQGLDLAMEMLEVDCSAPVDDGKIIEMEFPTGV